MIKAMMLSCFVRQEDTTDELIQKAQEIIDKPSKRELDAHLSVGEQVSITLAVMCLEHLRYSAINLNGCQAGIKTESTHGTDQIVSIDTEKISFQLNAGRSVITAGYQGVNNAGNIAAFGRGGADTTGRF